MWRTLRGAGPAQLRGQRRELAGRVVRGVAGLRDGVARGLDLRFGAVEGAPRLVQPRLGGGDCLLALADRLVQLGGALAGGGDEPLELGGFALARLALARGALLLGALLGRALLLAGLARRDGRPLADARLRRPRGRLLRRLLGGEVGRRLSVLVPFEDPPGAQQLGLVGID